MASSATAKKAATTGGDSLLFKVKLFFMVFLVVLDIVLNSSVEHDATGMGEVDGESNGTVLALILGSQLVIQVGIFASLFLMMFETYPFRVGLMGMLTSQYLAVYAINVVYLLMTVFVYGYRVTSMVRDNRMGIWEVWDLKGYLPLSILHKIAATIYYVTNIRAALMLGDPMFYSKQAWVGIYFDRGGGLGGGGGGNAVGKFGRRKNRVSRQHGGDTHFPGNNDSSDQVAKNVADRLHVSEPESGVHDLHSSGNNSGGRRAQEPLLGYNHWRQTR